MSETFCFPLVMKELPEQFMKKAEVELGETPEKKEICIMELRKLILEEKNLSCRTDDAYLMMFLRPRKFDTDRAFASLKSTFKLKFEFDFFQRIQNMNDFYDIVEKRIMNFLQYRDPEGRVIFVIKISKWNTNEVNLDNILATGMGFIYSIFEVPMTQVNGAVLIFDMEDLRISHIMHITRRHLQLMARGFQECIPLRLKAVHFVNENFLFKYIWVILKTFLNKKIRERVFFHGKNMGSLHQFIPPSVLPLEYGGDIDIPGVADKCKETKYAYNAFLEMMTFGYVNEEKRRMKNDKGITEGSSFGNLLETADCEI